MAGRHNGRIRNLNLLTNASKVAVDVANRKRARSILTAGEPWKRANGSDCVGQTSIRIKTLGKSLEAIPFAVHKDSRWDSKFDFVTDAVTRGGFEPVCGPARINDL